MHSHEKSINITIRDYGAGIPDDKLAQIFRPFCRIANARSREQVGYGLGLAIVKQAIVKQAIVKQAIVKQAIVKQAIELHSGRINVINALDGGLVINIDL